MREAIGIVRRREDSLRQVFADLCIGNVEGCGKLDVADMVAAQVDVHQPWNEFVESSVAIVLNTLHQRRGAVADANDCHTNFFRHGMRDPFRGLRVDRKGCQTRHDTTVRAVSFSKDDPPTPGSIKGRLRDMAEEEE
jgi:hypothetical protein